MSVGLRNYQKKILLIRLGIAFLLLFIILLSFSVYARFKIDRSIKQRAGEVRDEEVRLQIRAENLNKQVQDLKREDSQEAQIREHFDVAKEGEQVIILLDEPSDNIEPLVAPETVPDNRPWYKFW